MPAYRVKDPEGQTWKVNAPEGATEQDAIAYIKRTWKPSAQRQAPIPELRAPSTGVMPTLRRAASGIGDVFRAAAPGGEEPELGTLGKLGAVAVSPLAIPASVLMDMGRGGQEIGAAGASALAEKAPWLPPAVPATLGFAAGEVLEPLNWVGGPATKAFTGGGVKVPRALQAVDRAIPSDFQYSPSNIADQAKAIKEVGSGAFNLAKKGVQALRPAPKAAETAAEILPAPVPADIDNPLGLPTRQDFEQDVVNATRTKPGFKSETQQELVKRSDAGKTEVDKLEGSLERSGGIPEDFAGQKATIEAPVEQYPGVTPKATVKMPPQKPRWALVEGFEERGPAKVLEGKPGDSFTEVQFADGSKMRTQASALTRAEQTGPGLQLPPKPPTEPPAAPAAVAPIPPKSGPSMAGKRLNEAPEAASAKLPKDLSGANPRYSYGKKHAVLSFASDEDKALMIVAQTTPSKRDADYMAFLKKVHPDKTDREIRAMGSELKGRIKTLVRDAVEPEEGQLVVKVPRLVPPAVPRAKPKPVVAPLSQEGLDAATTPLPGENEAILARLNAKAEPPAPKPAEPTAYTPGSRLEAAAEGRETDIRTPMGMHKAQYRLVDLDGVKPSHDVAAGFRATEGYPAFMQPRDYAGNAAYQGNVLDNAGVSKFDPAGQIFTDTSSAIEGPPVILKDGSVVGGNGRTMTIKAAIQSAEGRQRQIDAVLAKAESFGIPRAQVEAMIAKGQMPMVVRELKDAPEDLASLRGLGAEFNKDIKKVADAAEDSYVKGTLISDSGLKHIAAQAGDVDLADALKTRTGSQEVIATLLKDKVITQNDLTLLVNPKTGALNDAGQRMVKDALAARLIGNLDLYRATPASFRDKLVSATGDLAHIESSEPSFRLGDRLKEALAHMVGQEARGIPRKEWLKQSGLPGIESDLSRDATALVEALIGSTKDFKQRMAIYAEAAPKAADEIEGQGMMFDLPVSTKYTPQEAFEQAFHAKMDKGGMTLGGDIVPGTRQATSMLDSFAKWIFGGNKKHFYDNAEDALGLTHFRGAADGRKWLVKQFARVAHVAPIWDHRMTMTKIAYMKSFQRFSDSAREIIKPISHNVDAMRDVALALDGKAKVVRDGKVVLEDVGAAAIDSLPAELQLVAQKLRQWDDAFAQYLGLPPEKYRTSHFPHVWKEPEKYDAFELGEIKANRDRLSPHAKAREGKQGYTFDLMYALDKYAYRSVKDLYTNQFVGAVQDDMKELLPHASKVQKEYISEWLSHLQGNPGELEQVLDNMAHAAADMAKLDAGGRPSRAIANKMAGNIYTAYLGGRLVSGIRNMADISNIISEMGFRNTLGGAWKLIYSPEARRLYRESGLDTASQVAETLKKSQIINRPKYREMIDTVLGGPMHVTDLILRGLAYHAARNEGIKLGLKAYELESFAIGKANKVIFGYGAEKLAPRMNNPLGKIIAVLKTYPTEQAMLQYRRMKEGEFKKLARTLAFDGMVVGLGAKAGLNMANWVGWEEAEKLPIQGVPFVGKDLKEWMMNQRIAGKRVGNIRLPIGALVGAASPSGPMLEMGARIVQGEMKPADWLALSGVPVLAYKEYRKLAQELSSGREVIKVQRTGPNGTKVFMEKPVGREISAEDAILKYLKFLPERDRKKINAKEVADKIYRAKQAFKEKASN